MSENNKTEDTENTNSTDIETEIGLRIFFSKLINENKKNIKIEDFPESI